MDPKFVAGVICFSTRRKSLVAGPSGEPWAGGEGGGVVEVCFNGGFNGRKIRHGSLLWENTGKLME